MDQRNDAALIMLNSKQREIYTETRKWIEGLPPSILELVAEYDTATLGRKSVVCTAILKTGYEITAYSVPVDIQDFNIELGRVLAKRKVLEELISLESYIPNLIRYKTNKNHSARTDGMCSCGDSCSCKPIIVNNDATYEHIEESEINE